MKLYKISTFSTVLIAKLSRNIPWANTSFHFHTIYCVRTYSCSCWTLIESWQSFFLFFIFCVSVLAGVTWKNKALLTYLLSSPLYCYAYSLPPLNVSWVRDSCRQMEHFSWVWQQRNSFWNHISGLRTEIPRMARILLMEAVRTW